MPMFYVSRASGATLCITTRSAGGDRAEVLREQTLASRSSPLVEIHSMCFSAIERGPDERVVPRRPVFDAVEGTLQRVNAACLSLGEVCELSPEISLAGRVRPITNVAIRPGPRHVMFEP